MVFPIKIVLFQFKIKLLSNVHHFNMIINELMNKIAPPCEKATRIFCMHSFLMNAISDCCYLEGKARKRSSGVNLEYSASSYENCSSNPLFHDVGAFK